ncbi:MAG: phosphoribosylformylglycinamidine cyclo-ligase, partial [Myxococcota bacterium]
MSDKPKASAYKQAGVDLDAADETVSRLGDLVDDTHIPGVLSGLGGFGGLFSLADAGLQETSERDIVLVSGTDGVGTKLELAFRTGIHDTIGIDCVAMCVNDVVVTGARPLFFLDYFATGKLSPQQAEDVVRGVAVACKKSGCALVGGETAEMPGFYDAGEYEIAGFCVGATHRDKILDPGGVSAGQTVIGLNSTGVHSNGFSLVRKIIADAGLQLSEVYEALDADRSLGEALLEPTALYP